MTSFIRTSTTQEHLDLLVGRLNKAARGLFDESPKAEWVPVIMHFNTGTVEGHPEVASLCDPIDISGLMEKREIIPLASKQIIASGKCDIAIFSCEAKMAIVNMETMSEEERTATEADIKEKGIGSRPAKDGLLFTIYTADKTHIVFAEIDIAKDGTKTYHNGELKKDMSEPTGRLMPEAK